ncbi:hypothetical protein DFS34DRAFT_324976 [Phlyctochytrium arcticum]|nr:hypothetical protein DFS34DRAFT_324976 [Phlyctochytrium arcticum]
MLKYQQTIEDRLRAEMEQQLTQFRSLELSQMRLDEKQRHQSEIKQVRLELERQHHEIKAQAEAALEKERQRLSEREKELESANMQLRQNILEENNKALIKEVLSRTDAELSAKEIKMERDSLQRKYEEVVTQLSQFQNLKERYAEKLQESMAQYKINVNKEYSSLVSSVEIDRAKIEAEQVLLQERARQIDKIVTEVHRDKEMVSSMQQEVKEAREQALAYRREKEAAEYEKKELKLQVMSHKTSSALEFEIQSLKQQLVETERMSEKRQEEYQSLLKTLIGPNDEMQKELNKVRRSESKWQRECQHLVKKLDTEMNRSEDLQRRLDEAVLQCKQLKRENSELKLSLHDTREAFGQSQQAKHHEDHSRDSRKRYNQSYLLDPLDPSLDITYGRSHVEPRTRIPILPEVHSIFSRPLDLDFSESIPPSAFVPQDDHQTFTSQSPKRYDTILPTENQTSIDRPTSNKTPTPRDGANHQLINATHTAKYDLDGKVADNETKSKTVSVYAKAEKTHSQKPIEIIGNVPTSSASPQALAKSTREQQEEERRAQDERAEIERQKAQRRQRDEERLKNERAEMERVRKEREELDRAEKKAKESASTDQRDNKVVAIEEKQSADQAREAQKAADKEKQKLDETNHAVQELENDPAMQKYIEMAKERREKLGMSTGSQKPDQRHPDDYQVEELMKKLDNSELMSSRDSDSRLFGAGATADEIR